MDQKQTDFRVAHLDCEHDAAALERGMKDFEGIVDLKVYPKSARVAITYDPAVITVAALKEKLDSLGFPVQEGLEVVASPQPWGNPKVLTSVASGLLLFVGWMLGLAGWPEGLSVAIYIVAILVGGYFFGREAIEDLIFERKVGIELLMGTAAVVAALIGQVGEGAMLVFLYSISEGAEGYTEEKTRSAVRALMNLAPKVARVRRDGVEREISVEEIKVGDVFIVKPGQSIATDGIILTGSSSINQAPVTGESVPVEKQPGDPVFAGSINGEGALDVRTTKTFSENTIARIIQMVEEAQEKKGRSQRFIERFGRRYSPAVLALGILVAIVPPLLLNALWATWITRATVFIVAAAPCALVISIPITLVASLGTGARMGVLIKGGIYLEELAKIKIIALDKTGTLTQGKPEVTDVILCRDSETSRIASSEALLSLASGIEQRSEHPLARAIIRYAELRGIAPAELNDFRALTGAGASARLNHSSVHTMVYIGKPDLFSTRLGINLERVQDDILRLQEQAKTVVLVGDEQAAWGLIAIRDNIRPNARKAIQALHGAGVQKVVMLTGDNPQTADVIARELGIDEVYADLKPEDKVIKVRELAERYGHVAMVGDGVNDAPALAEATIGIAMGAAGTDVALETADVALMADDLEKLAYALQLAKRTQSVVQQNLALSALVIGLFVVGAVAGVLSLPMAVVGHEVSEFVVITSGLRMLRA
ncbi:MAG: heavy metal translocating P-type ATPase (plasmid) [Candidatus Manganitrophus sp.]|nr:heavy metal translocating P-type ATPase [Candidatus Manganitrophus sp.]WDT73442.1 MAG: heavy metal translocating P-type ATPase [Candidatus Manganitrophus sp.]WDT77929.1 MAG: heavy metal translocating P-type ATPase [Candidatus Manganitrophus sp.]WDT82967.1 MAG: heavy metal translocating P-type ATPase [Candidatus Manganitrophus sp.]